MSDAWSALGGKRRTLARQVYARDSNTPGYRCPGCGLPIDWALEWPDPLSKTVDHLVELQDGGSLTNLTNLWSAHLGCNSSKGATRRHQREAADRPQPSVTIIAVDVASL